MSTSSLVALGSLRLQAQQRSDMVNNPAISTQEWNSYITNSYKDLYDILVGAYGNDYYVATTYQFSTSSQFVPLPDGSPAFQDSTGSTSAKFYKLLGVDLQYSASPSGWVSLQRFEFIERNKYAYPNVNVNWNGYTNLRYRIEGNNLYLVPLPQTGQTARIWYIPAPTNLQFMLPCTTTIATPTLGLQDTTGLSAGMNIAGDFIQSNTTILSLSSTSMTMSSNALATSASTLNSFWNDSTLMEGISGWDEYVIVDAAIKAQIKQENDIQALLIQRNEVKMRIEAMAEGRDAGQAQHVSDVLGTMGDGGFGGNDGRSW